MLFIFKSDDCHSEERSDEESVFYNYNILDLVNFTIFGKHENIRDT